MSSIKKNISGQNLRVAKTVKVAIVVSDYNGEITESLYASCLNTLKHAGAQENNIRLLSVPGAWELPFGCQMASKKKPDVIIALGCIIKGETPHFDFIANAVADAIMSLSLHKNTPVIFGVLTTLNLNQAKARIKGGKRGDKGVEAALAAIKMLNLKS